jgi:hypothetical protein
LNSIPIIQAHGELVDKGANDVTERGFRIIKQYKGDLQGADYYIAIAFGDFDVMYKMESHTIVNEQFTIIDYYWIGTFYRNSTEEGNFELGAYERTLGGGILGEGLGIYLKQNDTYLIQAIARNNLGIGLAKENNVSTLGYEIASKYNEGADSDYNDFVDSIINEDKYIISNGDRYVINDEYGISSDSDYNDFVDSIIKGDFNETDSLEGTFIYVTDDKLDSNKFVKTVMLGTVPSGCTVTRIGIRLGRTKGCNELHYFQDGSFVGTGDSVSFLIELEPDSRYYMMPYIIIDYGDYEEEILGMLNYTDPDMESEYLSKYPIEFTDDIEEDEENILTTNAQSGQGNYSYRSINKEITCEKIGHQGLIDYYGRRRAYTVNNHLIQTKDVCCVIISNYLDKFQRLKLKVAIDIDMPIPFEEQDVILLGDGKTLFKADTQGTILFKADGEGELKQQAFILAKIRKIGATFESGGSTIIPIELEV